MSNDKIYQFPGNAGQDPEEEAFDEFLNACDDAAATIYEDDSYDTDITIKQDKDQISIDCTGDISSTLKAMAQFYNLTAEELEVDPEILMMTTYLLSLQYLDDENSDE